MSISINNHQIESIHFTGIFGSGMSALAQFLAWQGIRVSGSDRAFNKPETASLQEMLVEAGCTIVAQNGAGLAALPDCVCVSTAIEQQNPDLQAAQEKSIPVVHRSDVLATLVKQYKTIAVAGTSGKSTVTAMIFEFLTACGKSPSLITGAPLKKLQRQSYIGNAFYGLSDLLVIEADESDGTLVKYTPYLSIILNVSKDHKSIDEIKELFKKLIAGSTGTLCNSDDPELLTLASGSTFSLDNPASNWHPDNYSVSENGGTLTCGTVTYTLPLLGKHNLSNCSAALAACTLLDCTPDRLSKAVALFEGVSRRFSVTKTESGITVIDDFAHNPEKIAAAIDAAHLIAPRLTVVYQPHGYGPTRFLRKEYGVTFSSHLDSHDQLFLLPIYYAGGSAVRDISSKDLKNDLCKAPFQVYAPETRDDLLPLLLKQVASGGCILLMGARDPSLELFADRIRSLF